MSFHLKTFVLITLFTSNLCLANTNPCSPASAITFTESFYKTHRDFYYKPSKLVTPLLTRKLNARLKNHLNCQRTNGLCHLDYEPWLGAQDGEVIEPISYTVKESYTSSAVITMSYSFVNGLDKPVVHTVNIKLHRTSAPQCWQMNDLITPLGQSLSESYKARW